MTDPDAQKNRILDIQAIVERKLNNPLDREIGHVWHALKQRHTAMPFHHHAQDVSKRKLIANINTRSN